MKFEPIIIYEISIHSLPFFYRRFSCINIISLKPIGFQLLTTADAIIDDDDDDGGEGTVLTGVHKRMSLVSGVELCNAVNVPGNLDTIVDGPISSIVCSDCGNDFAVHSCTRWRCFCCCDLCVPTERSNAQGTNNKGCGR